jgi:ketosteroid isomerase-like protein
MRKTLIVLGILMSLCATAVAQDKAAVVSRVRQFADAFNKGDAKTALAACADSASVIDEFPPYEWHGANACAKWMNDYDADAKKNGITGGMVTLNATRHVEVSGEYAYVVASADYSFKLKGKPVKETDSLLTVALRKTAAGWLITGWAWTKH